MKSFIHKSLSLFMVVVVLLTTMSFSVDMHYCGETLVDFSFSEQVQTCGMEIAKVDSDCENPSLSQKSCCSDQQIVQQGQDNLKISFDSFSLEQQLFVASFTYSYLSLFEETASHVSFVDHSPPFLKRDVQVLHQTFLI